MKRLASAPTAFAHVGYAPLSILPARVWVLASEKVGDNDQAFALAAQLGWTTEVKHVRYRARRNPILCKLTASDRFPLDDSASSSLAPPWPDLVIGCGRRSAAVALKIRRQAGSSTRLVHIGRPRTDLDAFDLVITTPQYHLPRHAKVMHLSLPMHTVDRMARERAALSWGPRLASLPRPWIAVLIGGATRPYVFSPAFAHRMAAQLNALARTESASLLVSTSRRTPADFADMLARELDAPSFFHHWGASSDVNPYLAYLQLADAFVVTGDSASMLSEACGTGKRVWFVDPPTRRPWMSRSLNRLGNLLLGGVEHLAEARVPVVRLLSQVPAKGWLRHRRDLRRLHAALIDENRALPLGRPFTTPPPPVVDEVGRVVARIRGFAGRTSR